MASKNLAHLAETLQMSVMEKGGPFGAPCAVGTLDGYPVAVAWTRRNNQSTVGFLVRCKKGSFSITPQAIGDKMKGSPELLVALGVKKTGGKSRKNALTIAGDGVVLFWDYSLFGPKPEVVAGVARALASIVKGAAQPVGTDCEVCGGHGAGELGSVSGALKSVCAGCRERMGEEDRRAMEEYAAREPNPMAGTLAGLAAAAAGAIVWGGVAYGLNRIFLWGGVLIGLGIAWSVNKAMGKVNLYGQALTVMLTVASVMAGDFFFLWLSAADQLHVARDLALARGLLAHFVEVEFADKSGYLSAFFALIGAGVVLAQNRAPVRKRQFVRAGA
jgi:hypothetical protein